jgi:hypothetical protein
MLGGTTFAYFFHQMTAFFSFQDDVRQGCKIQFSLLCKFFFICTYDVLSNKVGTAGAM